MSNYDFSSLSSKDFEELICDLLSEAWGTPLEAFKTGRDRGVDLRYATIGKRDTIIQCKHYGSTPVAKLIYDLANHERPKVAKLNPGRYVVVTSLGLTPANKEDIVQSLYPFIRTTGDVIGSTEIESLLRRFPTVEEAHYKLWITSTTTLHRVLHNAEQCQTEFEVEKIRRKLKLFVQHGAFARAVEILSAYKIVVISGVPGIGKTTLAEVLLYSHLEKGYQPVVIQGQISEGKRLFRKGARQIFYFDDFLGQTFLGDRKDFLGKNEDAALVNFVEMVEQSKSSMFILTTREHILQSAIQVSQQIAGSPLLAQKCVIEIDDYTFSSKARILFNHLYFSDLPVQYRDELLLDRFFLRVIRHRHFSPRLIEWLSSYSRLRNVESGKFRTYVESLLEDPFGIWSHAFYNQVSSQARHLLLVLYSMGTHTSVTALERPFIAYRTNSAAKGGGRILPGEFTRTLAELEGAFLTYNRGIVSFINPSVREFVEGMISKNYDVGVDLVAASIEIRQVVRLWNLAISRPTGSRLMGVFENEVSVVCDSVTRMFELEGSTPGVGKRFSEEGRLDEATEFLVELSIVAKSTAVVDLAVGVARRLVASWITQMPSFSDLIRVLCRVRENEWLLDSGGRRLYDTILAAVMDELDGAGAGDWLELLGFFSVEGWELSGEDQRRVDDALGDYGRFGIDAEIEECSHDASALGELSVYVNELSAEFGLGLDSEIGEIEDRLSQMRRDDEEYEIEDSSSRNSVVPEQMTEEEVVDLFESLLTNSSGDVGV